MDLVGWVVTAFAVLLTGISKSGLGGALGGLAVPFMSMWISPREAVAVMLPILIAMDFVGIRAWRGKADWIELRLLIPAALVGIAFGTLAFGVMSDRLVTTVSRLDLTSPDAVSRFRRDIRHTLEVFLRFTHRYYFSEVSDQAMLRDLFRLWTSHLGTAKLYAELREEIHDMSSYLETDMLRRQAVTILQLTVATLFSLIGTVTTGFLGMNIFGYAELPGWDRFLIFLSVFIPTTALTLYTVMKSQRLARFLDALANEKVSWGGKLKILADVWRKRMPLG